MGLAIVQKIVTAHGGTIEVSSQLNHGTTFTLFFPLQSGEEIKAMSEVGSWTVISLTQVTES
jgi:nitrogen-specific signal transduction histidine kinase